jgi:hypothetical protein
MQDAASPSTPRAQTQRNLYAEATPSIVKQLDQSPSSFGLAEESVASTSTDGLSRPTESDSKKEVWKKRKQM